MAKKGGVQQLQADLSTDEEFEKFLDRPGLLVLDVYSEWCGPCLGMVGSLKKIKLEIGGDNLHLAICKSDTISYLKRFNKKSEPTWLFVTKGKAINLMFGTNVPRLMKLIAIELGQLTKSTSRVEYAIDELQPEEVKRRKVKEDAIAEAEYREAAEKERKRREYLTSVTDIILENMPDIGVTLFGPQVNREMFKKIMEPADSLKIQCKDRKVITVYKENFETVNFDCKNPLPHDVIDQLDQKELLLCFWKMPDDASSTVVKTLQRYVHELSTKRVEPADEFKDEVVLPAILAPMEVKVEVELEDGEEYTEEEEEPLEDLSKKHPTQHLEGDQDLEEGEDEFENEEAEQDGEGADEDLPLPPPDMGGIPDFDLGLDMDGSEEGQEEEGEDEELEAAVVEIPKKRTRMKTISIPPVWVPKDARTHATLIYVFFRSQTAPFLPPDPIPEPPHIIMAFDAYKKKDLLDLAERYRDDVPLYGFFTSDDPNEAKYIANSSAKYATESRTPTDKIVFKVNKKTSHTMLSMATYGPSYVSPNTVVGFEEALKFFPENYQTAEMEAQAVQAEGPVETKKKKRKSKKSEAAEEDATKAEQTAAQAETLPAIGEEGATTTSGEEESGESRPATAEGEPTTAEGEGATAEGEPTETEEAAPPTDDVPAPGELAGADATN